MKVKASVKVYKKCKSCKIVRRAKGKGRKGGKVLRVICENPRHRQRQG